MSIQIVVTMNHFLTKMFQKVVNSIRSPGNLFTVNFYQNFLSGLAFFSNCQFLTNVHTKIVELFSSYSAKPMTPSAELAV